MAIAATDILIKLSVVTGSAGDSTAQGSPNSSLGKYVSTTTLTTSANGLFDNVSGAENAASTVDYRCVFIHNNHATLTAINVSVFLSAEVAGGTSIALALDNIAASAKGGASAQAALIASETTTPTGVGTFSSPTTDGAGIIVGDLAPGQVRAIWVRRTAANTSAVTGDGFTFGVNFDTAA